MRAAWLHGLVLVPVLVLGGCGGSDPVDTTPSLDAGTSRPGPTPDDLDGDEWPNAMDNCPMAENVEQRDRDQDGIGDACDTCPSTPNSGKNGEPGQDACALEDEAEPNDVRGAGQALALMPAGRLLAVRGVVEAPSGGRQSVDRYRVMIPARTLLSVRVARASMKSLLEPMISVIGGAWTATRTADGLLAAERQIYASEAGVYEIAVSDRRGTMDGDPRGGPETSYELSLRALDYVPERVAVPFSRRTFRLAPKGTVKILEADVVPSMRTRIAAETAMRPGGDGIDPILVLEAPDGSVLAENDDVSSSSSNARLVVPIASAQRVRLILDHASIAGDDALDLRLTFDQPPDDVELEPNDDLDLASPLIFPGATSGIIDEPIGTSADVDWYRFQGTAGQVVVVRALVSQSSQVNPKLTVGRAGPDGFVALYENDDSSGISSRADTMIYETGTYHVKVEDARNDGTRQVGGMLYGYQVLAEVQGLQPVSTTTQSAVVTGAINPSGKLVRHLVSIEGPRILEVRPPTVQNPELDPYVRVYGASGVGLLAEGEERLVTFLPEPGAYVVAVHNGNEGKGGPGFEYTLPLTLETPTIADEQEPNDDAGTAITLPAVVRGALSSTTDRDRVKLALTSSAALDAVLTSGGTGRTVTIYRGTTRVASGAGGVMGARPGIGQIEVEVALGTSSPGSYVLVVR